MKYKKLVSYIEGIKNSCEIIMQTDNTTLLILNNITDYIKELDKNGELVTPKAITLEYPIDINTHTINHIVEFKDEEDSEIDNGNKSINTKCLNPRINHKQKETGPPKTICKKRNYFLADKQCLELYHSDYCNNKYYGEGCKGDEEGICDHCFLDFIFENCLIYMGEDDYKSEYEEVEK